MIVASSEPANSHEQYCPRKDREVRQYGPLYSVQATVNEKHTNERWRSMDAELSVK